MTNDFLDALSEACEREGVPFIAIVGTKDGSSARVRSFLENWHTSRPDISVRDDLHQLLDAIDLP